ncbi:MAG: ATP-binding protein [Marivibrio sp.]|uniref:ATP-binding protein n=1 Tax=Marivibrio sp. TaxID=2039719 RepID=UPI0032F0427C
MRWSLLSVRFVTAIALFGVITCGSLLAALIAFQELRGGFDRLQNRTLPELIEAGRIAQYSQAIASTAPQLAAVDSEYARRTVTHEIDDQLRLLDEYLAGLGVDASLADGIGEAALAPILAERDQLVANLDAIDETVAARLAVESRFNQKLGAMRSLLERAYGFHGAVIDRAMREVGGEIAPEERRSVAAVNRWLETVDRMLLEGVTLAGIENPALIRRNERRAGAFLDEAESGLSATERPPASVMREMEALLAAATPMLRGPESIFASKARLAALRRAEAGLLAKNKMLANRFVGASRDLSAALQRQTEALSARFSNAARESALMLAAIALLGALGVLGIWLFVRRRILTRLARLGRALETQRSGRDAAIPTDGEDEITEIGRAARHFVDAVTEREQSLRAAKEEAERLAAEAEAANRAKSVFLANMSHELRTPLNAIIGFSDLLTDGRAGADKTSEYAADINDSGRHLLLLINDLLDYTKIEAGQRELAPAPIDAERTVRDLERLIQVQMRERNLKIAYAFPDDSRIEADQTAFRQVIVNLLSNAAKFSYEGETIEVGARRDEAAGRLALWVEDRGIGIAPEEIERVLQPFHQETASYTKRSGGTGLGLAIVDSLVRLHGGETQIDSVKHQGARVTVSFPLLSAEEASASREDPPAEAAAQAGD